MGGAPGESVFVKVGASLDEPDTFVAADNHFRLSVDKGNQGSDGADGISIGNIVKPTNEILPLFAFKTVEHPDKPFFLTTDSSGAAWVFVGTDSGFESLSTIYYSRIRIVFSVVK